MPNFINVKFYFVFLRKFKILYKKIKYSPNIKFVNFIFFKFCKGHAIKIKNKKFQELILTNLVSYNGLRQES